MPFHVSRSAMIFMVFAFTLALCAGCAVTNEDNRRTLNMMDGWIKPESTGTQIALAPVMVPAGTATLVTDMVIVHPICMIPKAADDVYELYWKPREMDFFRRALLFPVIVVATPPTFLVDWLGRIFFDIE
jgi:hypothetical protein